MKYYSIAVECIFIMVKFFIYFVQLFNCGFIILKAVVVIGVKTKIIMKIPLSLMPLTPSL